MYDFNIVTLHRARNYGAALQTYALKTHLCKMGYTTGIYDAEPLSALSEIKLKSKLLKLVNNLAKSMHKSEFTKKENKFIEFLKENFDVNNSLECKAFIAGSDQVWNPIVINPAYYLDFVPKNSVRASYAASIGVSSLPDSKKEIYQNYLSQFNYISVRETSAKAALQKFLPGKDIRVDLDPTFLLSREEWTKASLKGENKIKGNYILLYILHIPENINELCKWLKKELNANIVLIDTRGYLGIKVNHDIIVRNVGPYDFLALFRDATAVITTSFHGTAFSILFEKEFYSVINPDFPSRVQNVLEFFLSLIQHQHLLFLLAIT